MDRGLVCMSALMIAMGISPLMVGCKMADEGPKPLVMPAKPVLNLPSAYAGGPSNMSNPVAGIPASTLGKMRLSRKQTKQPSLQSAMGMPASAN